KANKATEDRRQKTEDRRQKTEDRRQKTEDRRQKTETVNPARSQRNPLTHPIGAVSQLSVIAGNSEKNRLTPNHRDKKSGQLSPTAINSMHYFENVSRSD
ncbi:MAG: hypothetical protein ACRC8O_07530, partial [Plesiomonas shigelloides]